MADISANPNQAVKELYEFGPFRVDPEKEILLRGRTCPAHAQTFQIPLVLVRNKTAVVTKDDLLKAVWPDTLVEEANVAATSCLLRKEVGESTQDHR